MIVMKKLSCALLLALVGVQTNRLAAQETPLSFSPIQVLTNREALLHMSALAGRVYRVETSSDLVQWAGLVTLAGAPSMQQTDSAAPFLPARFYRGREVATTNAITGDHLATAEGELTIHPVNHAAFVLSWQDKVIYCDPVGVARFQGLPRADLILITHEHSDHYDAPTISAVKGGDAVIVAPRTVYQSLPSGLKAITTVLTNGATTNWLGLQIEAVPAYNLTSSHHLKGVGNGYILTLGGKRLYISGDTEDTPELRGLQEIDVAFVCMNLPYTMSVDQAVSAVRQFQPKVVYVYHYSGYSAADVTRFKERVGTDLGIEARLRKWY